MDAQLLSLAQDEVLNALALIPSSAPKSWQGAAATACAARLDEAHRLMSGLETRFFNARSAISKFETVRQQCVVEP